MIYGIGEYIVTPWINPAASTATRATSTEKSIYLVKRAVLLLQRNVSGHKIASQCDLQYDIPRDN
jgi:hypothetical protein